MREANVGNPPHGRNTRSCFSGHCAYATQCRWRKRKRWMGSSTASTRASPPPSTSPHRRTRWRWWRVWRGKTLTLTLITSYLWLFSTLTGPSASLAPSMSPQTSVFLRCNVNILVAHHTLTDWICNPTCKPGFLLVYFVSISNNDTFASAPQAWFYLPEAQGQSHGDPEQGGWDREVSAMVFISLTLCTKSPGRSGVYLLTGFFFYSHLTFQHVSILWFP